MSDEEELHEQGESSMTFPLMDSTDQASGLPPHSTTIQSDSKQSNKALKETRADTYSRRRRRKRRRDSVDSLLVRSYFDEDIRLSMNLDSAFCSFIYSFLLFVAPSGARNFRSRSAMQCIHKAKEHRVFSPCTSRRESRATWRSRKRTTKVATTKGIYYKFGDRTIFPISSSRRRRSQGRTSGFPRSCLHV